jgi:hypothetical protein
MIQVLFGQTLRFVAYPAASRSCSSRSIRAGSCITQLNDVAFFVMVGNLILCEARPPLCLCKPISSILWLAYCKLSTQLSFRPKLHNVLHELHSCRVKSIYSRTISDLRQTAVHATNSGGNICSQSFSLIFGSPSGMHAVVSNRSPHFAQDHRLTTNRSLTNSDQSGAISASPHLTHFIVIAILSSYSCFPLRECQFLYFLQLRVRCGDLR